MKSVKRLNKNEKNKTRKITRLRIAPLLPLIFKSQLKASILHKDKTLSPPDYLELCKKLYSSANGRKFRQQSHKLLHGIEGMILYMNFKSHSILDPDKRGKLYSIIESYKPDYICLSEALLPVSIANNKNNKETTHATIVEIASIKDDTILQPYKACKKFTDKKIEDNKGVKSVTGVWRDFFIKHGYNYIVFANPSECPWGENWGNCIITKMKPDEALVLQMGSYGKLSFDAPESRSMVCVKMGNEYICSTHLDNSSEKARTEQARESVCFIKDKKMRDVTLVGDINAINPKSYSAMELKILRLLNIDKKPLPHDAIEIFNKSTVLGGLPINTGQKYESLYQKCVTHAYSTKYKKTTMIFTDATDFDHQPLFVW